MLGTYTEYRYAVRGFWSSDYVTVARGDINWSTGGRTQKDADGQPVSDLEAYRAFAAAIADAVERVSADERKGSEPVAGESG